MGLFDKIRWEPDLPGNPVFPDSPDALQSKDMPAYYLTEYTITANGELFSRPLGKEDKTRDYFSGEASFYGTDVAGDWWEYSATFADGTLISVALVESPPSANVNLTP